MKRLSIIMGHSRNEPPFELGVLEMDAAYRAAEKAIRQGGAEWVTATPVDFSSNGPEMIRHSERWPGIPGRESRPVKV